MRGGFYSGPSGRAQVQLWERVRAAEVEGGMGEGRSYCDQRGLCATGIAEIPVAPAAPQMLPPGASTEGRRKRGQTG